MRRSAKERGGGHWKRQVFFFFWGVTRSLWSSICLVCMQTGLCCVNICLFGANLGVCCVCEGFFCVYLGIFRSKPAAR